MKSHPDHYSRFYRSDNITLDVRLIELGYPFLRPHFRGRTCLELGPATGYMTRLLVKDFGRVTAVEGSGELLAQIPDFANLEKVHALFEDFSPAVSFDTVMMNHVLEHIEKPVALLRRIRGWMAPEGVLILGVPNAQSFHRLAAVHMGLLESEYAMNERDRELGHYRVYDLERLRAEAEDAGYSIIHEGGTFLKFLSNAQIETVMDDRILEAYHRLGAGFAKHCAEVFLVLTVRQ